MSQSDVKQLFLKPRMSEKAYGLSQLRNTYVFDVPGDANKHSVARAVAAQFEVEVVKVNIANIPGKAKRTIRKSGRSVNGRQSDVAKAYVTLKKGFSLPLFAALEQETEQAEKAQAQVDKVADKVAEKEAKKDAKADKKAEKKGGLLNRKADKEIK
jgi:large subunit ribosomal protein L23